MTSEQITTTGLANKWAAFAMLTVLIVVATLVILRSLPHTTSENLHSLGRETSVQARTMEPSEPEAPPATFAKPAAAYPRQ